MLAAVAAACTRLGWWGGALSQTSSLGTSGRPWPNAATKAAQSSWRLRSRMRETNSPVAAVSAPCTTRRALRPLTTTTCCSPRCPQPARSGGNSRSVVSSPNHTSPPAATLAAACSATAFFLGVGRVGPPQHVLRPLPSPAQPMERAAHGALGGRPAPLGQLRTQERRCPAGRRIAVCLRRGAPPEQRMPRRPPPRDEAAHPPPGRPPPPP